MGTKVHGMIDLETLGVNPDSTIITLGAIKFDPYTDAEPHSGLYLRCDIEEQTEQLGRSVDDNTLAWWSRQDQKIQDEAFGEHDDRVDMDQLTKALNKWCVGIDELWCQGPLFDYAILQNLYAGIGKPCPWNFWQIRDSRTLFAMMPQDPRKAIQEELHNALADCYYQAKCVQQSYKHFGVEAR
jgi:exodeoxyribonuclease VIII|tara:strand:+ start:1075 stop:1626 length:552 start_codon:yes stop_codon:yes gene_type:complete